MSTSQLEHELRRHRHPERGLPPSGATRLSIGDAIAYRDSGNIPDEHGRTLRLVLRIVGRDDLQGLDAKRRTFEPDYLAAPTWRREGSVPVNVVPLRDPGVVGDPVPWWERPDLAALESEWRTTGRVMGLAVPKEYRGFVYKTVLALRAAGSRVDATSVADAIGRWVEPDGAAEIRGALIRANADGGG